MAIQGAAPHTIEDCVEYQGREQQRFRPGLAPVPIMTASILRSDKAPSLDSEHGHGMQVRHGAEVAFTDRAGAHWVRRATGQLEELGEDPITHYLGPDRTNWRYQNASP